MAGVRIRYSSYGSPGDVEYKDCEVPESLTKFYEVAKEGGKEKSGFITVKTKTEQNKQIESAVSLDLIEEVLAL